MAETISGEAKERPKVAQPKGSKKRKRASLSLMVGSYLTY
jgi:hypothetical protein